MAVDLLRSCYTTEMEFFDPPSLRVPVTWYFCAENAKILPFWTRFASGNWASSRTDWFGPGEVSDANRGWSNGEFPGPNPVERRGFIFFGGDFATANTWTSFGAVNVGGPSTMFAVVAYRINAGPGLITSVTDTTGRIYFKDFSGVSADDPTVALDVWRAQNVGGGSTLQHLTINFPGSTITPTIWWLFVTGLIAQGPTHVQHNSGTAPVKPSVPTIETDHLNQYCLAALSCADISAITTIPRGFDEAGFSPTSPFQQGGEACDHPIDRHQSITLKWNATLAAAWIAAGLVYQGVRKELPPGQKYCGTEDMMVNGPSPAARKVCASEYGYAACCFDFLDHVNCCNFKLDTQDFDTLQGEVIGVHNPEPLSAGFAGLKFEIPKDLLAPVYGYVGRVYPRYLDDPLSWHDQELGCYQDVIFSLNVFKGGQGTLLYRSEPFGAAAYGVLISDPFGPFNETWDVVFNAQPPLPPPPSSTTSTLPPGFLPYSFWPDHYL